METDWCVFAGLESSSEIAMLVAPLSQQGWYTLLPLASWTCYNKAIDLDLGSRLRSICSDDSAQGSHTDSSAYLSQFVHEARAHAKSWIVREKAPREGGSSLHHPHAGSSNKRTDHNISTVHSTSLDRQSIALLLNN